MLRTNAPTGVGGRGSFPLSASRGPWTTRRIRPHRRGGRGADRECERGQTYPPALARTALRAFAAPRGRELARSACRVPTRERIISGRCDSRASSQRSNDRTDLFEMPRWPPASCGCAPACAVLRVDAPGVGEVAGLAGSAAGGVEKGNRGPWKLQLSHELSLRIYLSHI